MNIIAYKKRSGRVASFTWLDYELSPETLLELRAVMKQMGVKSLVIGTKSAKSLLEDIGQGKKI